MSLTVSSKKVGRNAATAITSYLQRSFYSESVLEYINSSDDTDDNGMRVTDIIKECVQNTRTL
jgi:hypothetical protein